MNDIAYFISDAHLGITPPMAVLDRENLLIEWIYSIRDKASHLIILGDLFEFWYEYRYYVSGEHMALFSALSQLVKNGVKIVLLKGNHDFAYGKFFPKELGINVYRELELTIQGKKIYMHHGDGVPKSDRGYRLMRRILDFPLNRKLFSFLHPDLGMALAQFVGRNSRKWGEDKAINIDEYLQWGSRVLEKKKGDFCIHGHHHIAGIWNIQNGCVASPGEWIKKPSYLKLEKGLLSLEFL